MTNNNISVVIVTYDDRWQYLYRVLEHLEYNSYVSRVVLIDNASKYSVADRCCESLFKKVSIHRNESNLGSAGGFSKGISLACEKNDSLILLLDDDNLPRPGSIKGLIDTYNDLTENRSYKNIAVLAFRENLHANFKIPKKPVFMHGKDFLCFNIFNAIQRHLKLIKFESIQHSGPEYAVISGGIAYSGIMFSPGLVLDIGLPNSDFILYFDDFEYSIRMLKSGYTIWLDRENSVDDILENYSASAYQIPFWGFWLADSDSKIYYNIRNRVYLDHFLDSKISLPYLLNRTIFLFVFSLICLLTFRLKRLKTFFDACHDGKNGHLGLNNGYPL
ncbi:MAG TPA: glycosyltransferase family 2 protein [Desulfuromonadales bacterium]|nr:glycosyltransferase family 2 protein [Desulfuromonadales bacterium]